MKRMLGIFVIIAMLALSWEGEFNSSFAQPTEPVVPTDTRLGLPDDLHLSIGFKTWFNDWMAGGEVFRNGSPKKLDTFGEAFIPTLGLRYKDFFISASGMFGKNYHRGELPGSAGIFGQVYRMTLERQEVDVNLGYYVLPWLAISAGYKGVFPTFDCHNPGPPFVCDFRAEYAMQGPTVGVSFNVPIPQWNVFPAGFSVYGNVAGGYLDVQGNEVRGVNEEIRNYNHAWYSNIETGIAYKLPALPIALTAGYRYQAIVKEFTSRAKTVGLGRTPTTENDITKGGVIGITFVF